MAKNVLIRPVISEKADELSTGKRQYTFVVERRANKIEIRKSVEEYYQVAVESVNMLVMPAKAKNRNTRAGLIRGRKSPFKKAVVTLAAGEEINLYGEI